MKSLTSVAKDTAVTPKDQRKEALLADLIRGIAASDPAIQRESLMAFAGDFYTHTSYDDLTRLPLASLSKGFKSLWEFMQDRPKNQVKYRILYWTPDFQTTIAPRLIIQTVNDDMSFLVGSLLSMLSRFDLKPRRVLHPVVTVCRDDGGRLQGLWAHGTRPPQGDPQGQDGNVGDESIIHCEIVEGASPDLIPALEAELANVFRDVRRATDDWSAMAGKIADAALALGNIKGPLSPASNNAPNNVHADAAQNDELIQFLEWIRDDHFTFLGYAFYTFLDQDGSIPLDPPAKDMLGILKETSYQSLSHIFEGVRLQGQKEKYLFDAAPLLVNKSSQTSKVHRGVPLDTLGIKLFDQNGTLLGMHLFVGLFTSVAYDSSIRDIPLLRRKVDAILDQAGLSSNWHNGKSLIHILDTLPRDDLFQASTEELADIAVSVLYLQEQNRLALFIRRDLFDRFLSCLVYIPQHRFDSDLCDLIGRILSQNLGGDLSHYKAQFGSLPLARVHYIVTLPKGQLPAAVDIPAIESKLIDAARTWDDDTRAAFVKIRGDYEGARLFRRFRGAFDDGYKGQFTGDDAVHDGGMIDALIASGDSLSLHLYRRASDDPSCLRLKLYHRGDPVPLSDILPILENLDLHVIKESPFLCRLEAASEALWIHDLETRTKGGYAVSLDERRHDFAAALYAVHNKKAESDGFNRLILGAHLTLDQCGLLRAFAKYLRQLQSPFSRDYMESVLLKYPDIASGIVRFFEGTFNPATPLTEEERGQSLKNLYGHLDTIHSPDEDRILRSFVNLAAAALRTSYYQRQADGNPKPYLSIKFESGAILDMPLPRPLYEIFVYSPRFEAIHLRGGKVARGGIRWSDRIEDYRTEVLGLVKAQMVKNTVIVPVGSKGGFVLKNVTDTMDRDEVWAEGIACYQMMMSALLDLTDNLVGGTVIPPQNTVRRDGDDPYLVVAADKGTATFSDYANKISQSYGFWLGDAFASGGSDGYDHKKMGITARGAFESIKRHFYEMGQDVQKDPIRVVGVGDMSGDVFGNGMLLSTTYRLVAAFNHQHIFIDPEPDVAAAFAERERLFNLARSTWQDYNKDLISLGGGVFDRKAKIIPLTPEIQSLLKISDNQLTPSELIRRLLCLDIDLLWFGGIGTFIKSTKESNSDVGDKANDSVRVNGRDLRCKVVAEGANLGITQLGRVEFALKGGRINTDATDNAAGVNCSDHEVNLKILFNQLIAEEKLDIETRNQLLEDMTQDVADLILRDNKRSALALSLELQQGSKLLDSHGQLIRYLESAGKLIRSIEFLPDDGAMAELSASGGSLSRPEIAVLSAHSKIDFYDGLLASSILSDPSFDGLLLGYFPPLLQGGYRDAILRHPLRREIIATLITNDVISTLSSGYVYDLIIRRGISIDHVVKAYFVTKRLFDVDTLWQTLAASSPKAGHHATSLAALLDLLWVMRRTISWMLSHYDLSADIDTMSAILGGETQRFLNGLHHFLDGDTKSFLEQKIAAYEQMGMGADLASRLAVIQIAATSPDIILMASQSDHAVADVASVYFVLGQQLGMAPLRRRLDSLIANTSWQRLAISGIQDDLYALQNRLVLDVLNWGRASGRTDRGESLIDAWLTAHTNRYQRLTALLHDAFALPTTDLSIATVIVRELRDWTE